MDNAKSQKGYRNKVYANPLPIIFSPSKTLPWLTHVLPSIFDRTQILNPKCKGVFDSSTSSVWILDTAEALIFWQRGFFGKGSLSRSEPTWLARQTNLAPGVRKEMTAEEVTAKRREQRKKFKSERAQAMAVAAAEAEAAFVITQSNSLPTPPIKPIPSQEHPPAAPPSPQLPTEPPPDHQEIEAIIIGVQEHAPEDLEHLQLTLSEAFFLAWGLGCLTISDPSTDQIMTLAQIWTAFLSVSLPCSFTLSHRWDNPFIVNYVVYHHFRSLGWVVKGGIKFCVDYLLYKRGPVFHHAEFAVVLCPVYDNPEDQLSSPFNLPNTQPFTWSWLSTINRVNSQVKKTLILAYITIPSSKKIPSDKLNSPACLPYYSIREVTIRRFVPARMRD